MLAGVVSISQNCSSQEKTHADDLDLFQKNSTELGIRLFRTAQQSSPDENLVLSPFDAQLSLSMTANLIDGSFADQICSLLGTGGTAGLNSANKSIIERLAPPTVETDEEDNFAPIPTKISNAVWIGKKPSKQTVKTLSEYYFATTHHNNLSSKKASAAIAEWMASSVVDGAKTSDLSIPPNTDIAVFSQIYFNQQWDDDYHFYNSFKDTFHSPGGDVSTNFMQTEILARYLSTDSLESVILAMSRYHMICVRPANGSLDEAINSFEAADLQAIIDNSTPRSIDITFPVFKFNSRSDLTAIYENCGITFPPATNVRTEQMSTIGVDQVGVAAGSATKLYLILSAPETEDIIELKFDRPFMFFIVDPDTKALLMAGQYVSPS